MKTMMIIALAAFAAMFAGCASTKASWGGEELVRGADGLPIVDKDGKVQVVRKPVEISAWRHWFDSEIGRAKFGFDGQGRIDFDLDGYNGATSEQFGLWTKEMWGGMGAIARLAAAAYNPAASAVPLSADAANGEDVGRILKAKGDADVALAKTRNELAVAKMNNEALRKTVTAFVAAGGNLQNATTACADGSCTVTDGTVTCTDGVCTAK